MADIKVIALDIYGTVLASEDYENEMPARKGIENLFEICRERRIKIVTSSDEACLKILKINLSDSGVDISKFDNFYVLGQNPKDFSKIIKDYKIKPEELLVIGDSNKDIQGAIKCGAWWCKVNEYQGYSDNFDLSSIL